MFGTRRFTGILLVLIFTNFWFIPRGMAEMEDKQKAGVERSLSELIQDLRSEEKLVRARAAEELGNKKDRQGVPFLIESLRDKEWMVRWQVCVALGKIKDKRAIPVLIEMLANKKENWSIQIRAADALVDIGDIAAFRPLVDKLRYECEQSRGELDPPIPHSFGSDDEAFESRIARSLLALSVSSSEVYIPMLLKEIKATQSAKQTKEILKFRYYLAITLGQLGEKEVVPTLIEYLRESDNGLFREKCARILGDLKDKRAVAPLKEALKDDFICVSTGQVRKVYGYTVRLAAYSSLKKLGINVERKAEEYQAPPEVRKQLLETSGQGGQKPAMHERDPNIPAVGKVVEIEPRFSQPEEMGEDFSLFASPEVVRRLAASKDKIEMRKAAKVLGDRSIAGKLELSSEEKQEIAKIVDGYLKQAKSKNANERVEASQQIERLWYVAAPTLLKNINSKEPAVAELAIKSLILMRNEAIIREIIKIAQTTDDDYTKAMAVFALKKMKEQRKSLIPDRKCLDEKESDALYNRLIAPALKDLEQ